MPTEQTWVVLTDDPEFGYPSVEDALEDRCAGEIAEMEECKVVRTLFGVWMWSPDSETRDYREFDTVEAAKAWIAERRAAIQAYEDAAP